MDVFDLAAKITLDTSEYERGLGEAEGKASSWGNGLGKAAKVAGAALAAATTAVTAFTGASVKVGMGFDQSMSQVAATMGKTVDQIEELRDFALQMGRSTAFSAGQAADALNYMALAGYDAETSMSMLPNVLNLAAAGNIDLARASDMVTDTQTAFGITLERTSQMVDEMAKAASTGNTSVEQLGDAFLTVGGLAKNLNGGMIKLADGTTASVDGVQELEIALTAMANAGVKGSEAGTHMRNMLLKLASPTDEGAQTFERLGVKVFDAEGNMRSLKDVMGDLSGALSNLTQEEKMQAISEIFNTRDMASAEALLSAVNEDWDAIGESILNAQGAAEEMAAVQLDNLAGDTTLFRSALEVAQIAISDQLTPALRQFAQFGTEAIGTLSAAFAEGGLSGAIDALSGLLTKGLQMIIDGLPKFVQAGLDILMAVVEGILNNLPNLVQAALQIVLMLANSIIDKLPELIPAVIAIILAIATKLTEPSMLMQLIDVAFKLLDAMAQGLINAIPTLIANAPIIIGNLVSALLRLAPQLLASGTRLIIELTLGLVRAIPNAIQGILQVFTNIKNSFVARLADAKNWGKDLIANFIDGIKSKINALTDSVKGVASKVKSLLGFSEPEEGPLSDFHTYAPDMMALFAKGIKDNTKKVRDQLEKSLDFDDLLSASVLTDGADLSVSSISSVSGATGANTINAPANVNIQVYASDGMDIDALAEKIMRKFTLWETQRQEGFA